MNTNKPYCIHSYLTVCKTDYLSPGFGDWLRGTVTLWKYCQTYGYDLFIDKDVHPIFQHLEENESLISNPSKEADSKSDSKSEVVELYSPMSFTDIDKGLRAHFERKESFATLTNGIYVGLTPETTDYYGPIPRECKEWLKNVLTPNPLLKEYIQNVYALLGVDLEKPYRVIHLRLGDNYLHRNYMDDHYLEKVNRRIGHTLRTESEYTYILLCDTSIFGTELTKRNPQLHYWDNKKIHTGEIQYDTKQTGVRDTLVDFFILSKAIHIMSIFDSGFSRMCSFI